MTDELNKIDNMQNEPEIFNWEDFKSFNVPPETLAKYCNNILKQRSVPVRLCQHKHDIIREDANWTSEYLKDFPNFGRLILLGRKAYYEK